ncbi:MAG TPA: ribonuclease III [Acidimicrobiales bacterium]|nr:ribonuclease III [Acidimicrobiales bacterium]
MPDLLADGAVGGARGEAADGPERHAGGGLEKLIAPYLNDPALYRLALAHRSYCAEAPGTESNERLEFLGDAVLGLVVTDILYRGSPDLAEGELAKARATIVSADSLARTAARMQVGEALLLGKGEEASGGRSKPSLLADAFEALIGAVYLDGGFSLAQEFVTDVLGDRIAESIAEPGLDDHKGRLQELVARFGLELPRYTVTDTGPDHAKQFVATVTINGEKLGTGEGRSKKQAEQQAAAEAAGALRARS